ncbi:MAG: pyrroline-5-carboxylate reductase [Devosia sp.]
MEDLSCVPKPDPPAGPGGAPVWVMVGGAARPRSADRTPLDGPAAAGHGRGGYFAKAFAQEFGVRLLQFADGVLTHVLVLAVKPQNMPTALQQVLPVVGKHTLVLSIAAGISLDTLAEGLGTKRVVRTMPNTPAQLGKGITGAVGLEINGMDQEVANLLLRAAGDVVWFASESMIDAVTAVSGSGPAYVFYLVEALAAAAVREGFDPDDALHFARQTVIGAAALLEADHHISPSTLRENVTSPKGTTAAALSVLMAADGLAPLVGRTVRAARQRSEELGRG